MATKNNHNIMWGEPIKKKKRGKKEKGTKKAKRKEKFTQRSSKKECSCSFSFSISFFDFLFLQRSFQCGSGQVSHHSSTSLNPSVEIPHIF
jgi:hypothetical protein